MPALNEVYPGLQIERSQAQGPEFDFGLKNTSETAWQQQAACPQANPDTFFPEKGESSEQAKLVCGRCAVEAKCLEYALSNPDECLGVWGGKTHRQRVYILRKRDSAQQDQLSA